MSPRPREEGAPLSGRTGGLREAQGAAGRTILAAHAGRREQALPSPPRLPRAPRKRAAEPGATVLIFQSLVAGISAPGLRRCWYSSACLCLLKI